MHRTKHYVHVYHNWWHVAATLAVVMLPFLFLLAFSQFAQITFSSLALDVILSSWRLFVAYILAVGIGWLLAVLFYRGHRATVALPLFDVLQSFPTFAAMPLAVSIWGNSNTTIIVFLVITIIWPIFFSILSSLKLMKSEWHEVVEVAGLRGWRYVRLFLIPVTIPGLITGSIVGLGEGWEALVATEIIVEARTGLGSFFQMHAHDSAITAFGILGFLLFIFTINKLLWLPLLEWSHHYLGE